MSDNPLRVELAGVREAVEKINRLGVRLKKTHARNAVSAAGGIFRRAIEERAPEESGTLKRHIRTRVKANRNGEWFAAIGARRKVKVRGVVGKSKIKQAVAYNELGRARRITERMAGILRGAGKRVDYRSPSRYIHLANDGAKSHYVTAVNKKAMVSAAGGFIGTRAITFARGTQFVKRAASSKSAAASQAAIRQLQKAITQEARNG